MLAPFSPADPFAVAGCPVCQALPQIEADRVDWFCRHAFSDPGGRDRVLAVGGLCSRHWWLVATGERAWSDSMVGTAELLAEVIRRFGRHGAVAPCPLCADTEVSARRWFRLVLDNLGPVGLDQAPPSWRPCLPHVEGLRELDMEPWLARWIDERQDRTLAEAVTAARCYVHTRRHRAQKQATGAEGEELFAAMAALLGDPDGLLGDQQAVNQRMDWPMLTLAEATEWARTNPARRDAMLTIAQQAVGLQPAAEVVIQLGRAGEPEPGWAGEARRVHDAYRMLGQQLDALGTADHLVSELTDLLQEHRRLVALVLTLQGARSHSTRVEQVTLEGLGPVAGRLVALRDLLRRTVPIDGRAVADLHVHDRL